MNAILHAMILGLLGVGAALAAGGFIRATRPWMDRSEMPMLLVAFILAVGFAGLIA